MRDQVAARQISTFQSHAVYVYMIIYKCIKPFHAVYKSMHTFNIYKVSTLMN